VDWIEATPDPRDELDSLPGVLWHLSDAWARRHEPNVVLVHYEDLAHDLEGEMRRLARRLAIEVPDEVWPPLVAAASFDEMRSRAEWLAPDAAGVLRDRSQFFRRGRSGDGWILLSPPERARYLARASELAPAPLLEWLHRPRPLPA
jgi:aryl sulfotransferase